MPGGLLNLVAYGNLNLILNGNPSKTFFKTTYSKYTNFGLQKFRMSYHGAKQLSINEDSTFSFTIDNIGDLFLDSYFVVQLPNIYSPILTLEVSPQDRLAPYEFKWIENIGVQMIRSVKFMIDGQIIQEFTGQYLYNMVQRDFSEEKKKLFSQMIGNVPELNDPANYNNRDGNYPNVWYDSTTPDNFAPSILARKLYVPLNVWSTLSSKMAIPLLCLQYAKLIIEVRCRPISELFVVRDIMRDDVADGGLQPSEAPYIKTDQNIAAYQFHRFVNQPQNETLVGTTDDEFKTNRTDWNQDIHIICTSAFLSEEEQKVFKYKSQNYLIKEVHEETQYNSTGTKTTRINSHGLVASWMWYFQRDDVNKRNQWSNYTNWPEKTIPYGLSNYLTDLCGNIIYYTDLYTPENEKDILLKMSILFDGKLRENEFDSGVYSYTEKYLKTAGCSEENLYCYNFCLDTDPFKLQPSGAVNLSKFTHIEFRFTTLEPPFDSERNVLTAVCNNTGEIISSQISGVNIMYKYNYNLHIMEERYNVLTFRDGMSYLLVSR